MPTLRKLLALPAADRMLLFRAAALLGAIRVGLWILPFPRLRAVLARASPPRRPAGAPPPERVAWAVSRAARYVPRATCLVQALATKRLLARLGHDARLHIGVAKAGADRLEAHAWVESGGEVLVGGLADLSRYTPLPPLPAERH